MAHGEAPIIAIELWKRINYSLFHAGLENVVRSVTVPDGVQARLRVASFSDEIVLPSGTSGGISPRLDPQMFALLTAPIQAQVVISIAGHGDQVQQVQVIPLCAWDQRQQYTAASAAFVLENDAVIGDLVRQAGTLPDPVRGLPPAEEVAERIYRELVPFFGPSYQFERSLFPPDEQAVRFPLQMKYDLGGTCLDLCLAYAAALLKSGLAPLLLLLGDRGGVRHSLAGVWVAQPPGFAAPDLRALEAARQAGLWVPIEATAAFDRRSYQEARHQAERQLAEDRLCAGVDVLACRHRSLQPLPGKPCTTTFNQWEARIQNVRTMTLATAAAQTLSDLMVEVVSGGHPGDLEKCWELKGFRAGIGRGYRHDIGLLEITVSDPHAVILSIDGRILVEDLRSRNGTWTPEGQRIPPGQFHPLRLGETFQVGNVKLRVIPRDERRLRYDAARR